MAYYQTFEPNLRSLKYILTTLPWQYVIDYLCTFHLTETRIKNYFSTNFVKLEKFGQRIQNHFSGKTRQTLQLFKNFLTLSILSLYIGVSWSFFLYWNLSRMFLVIEYWYKDQECKTWSANTKPLCWQSNVKLEFSKNVSLHIRVFYWKS